jgi:hypothetical protein
MKDMARHALRWTARLGFLALLGLHASVLFVWHSSTMHSIAYRSTSLADGLGAGICQGVCMLNVRWGVTNPISPTRARPNGLSITRIVIPLNAAGQPMSPLSDPLWRGTDSSRWRWQIEHPHLPVSHLHAAADSATYLRIRFPAWLAVVFTGAPLVLWCAWKVVHTQRRRRRLIAGLCPHCGYDVRANPQRCSECGWMLPAAAAVLSSQATGSR